VIIQQTKNAELVGPVQHFLLYLVDISYMKGAGGIGCFHSVYKTKINISLLAS
jgi:hypothetical protein